MNAILSVLVILLAAPLEHAVIERPFDGTPAVLTREHLDSLSFASKFDPAVKALSEEHVRDLSIGVWTSKQTFAPNEPAWAYFVLRNASNEAGGVDMRLDLWSGQPTLVNSCNVDLKNAAGLQLPFVMGGMLQCGSSSVLTVPANGYYVVRADLNRDKLLTAGAYEVSWNYGPLQASPVRFKVSDEKVDIDAKPPGQQAAFIEINTVDEIPKTGELEMAWDGHAEGGTNLAMTDDVVSALATGVTGRWYPNPLELPSDDGQIVATSTWAKNDAGDDTIVVTLSKSEHAGRVLMSSPKAIYLQVVSDDPIVSIAQDASQQLSALETAEEMAVELDRPMRIHVRVPASWQTLSSFGGKARVAVVIASDELEPEHHERLRTERVVQEAKVWQGVVRTPFVDVDLGPRAAQKQE